MGERRAVSDNIWNQLHIVSYNSMQYVFDNVNLGHSWSHGDARLHSHGFCGDQSASNHRAAKNLENGHCVYRGPGWFDLPSLSKASTRLTRKIFHTPHSLLLVSRCPTWKTPKKDPPLEIWHFGIFPFHRGKLTGKFNVFPRSGKLLEIVSTFQRWIGIMLIAIIANTFNPLGHPNVGLEYKLTAGQILILNPFTITVYPPLLFPWHCLQRYRLDIWWRIWRTSTHSSSTRCWPAHALLMAQGEDWQWDTGKIIATLQIARLAFGIYLCTCNHSSQVNHLTIVPVLSLDCHGAPYFWKCRVVHAEERCAKGQLSVWTFDLTIDKDNCFTSFPCFAISGLLAVVYPGDRSALLEQPGGA